MSEHESHRLDFELPNVGRGSETVQSHELVADGDDLLVVLLGSHYCSRSRELVRSLCEHHEVFRGRATTVVPVLPDIRERAKLWDQQYDLPFPMLVDPAAEGESDGPGVGDGDGLDEGDDTDTFGVFGPLQESVGTLPAVVLCRNSEDGLDVVGTETEASLDVPVVESLLGFLDRHQAAEAGTTRDSDPVDS